MEIWQSVLSEIATHENGRLEDVDIGALVRRILLFDQVIVSSFRLREIPVLVRAFGKTGFQDLLASGLLKFNCEFTSLIVDIHRNGVRNLPYEHFSFGIADAANREDDLRKELGGLRQVSGLKNRDREAIEEAIWNSIVRPGPTFGQDLLQQFDSDVRSNNPALKHSLLLPVRTALNRPDIALGDLTISVEETEARTFRIISNLERDFGLSPSRAHYLLQSAVTGASNLTKRLEEMKAYSAVIGFRESEAEILFGRLASVIAPQNPEVAESSFERTIRVVRLPDYSPGQRVSVDGLLKARESSECRDFRIWLSHTENMSDSEIEKQATAMRSLIGNLIGSSTGKVLRFATTTLVGFVPGVAPLLSVAASALDTFVAEKLFPRSGVVAFLNDQYSSLYKQ